MLYLWPAGSWLVTRKLPDNRHLLPTPCFPSFLGTIKLSLLKFKTIIFIQQLEENGVTQKMELILVVSHTF